MKVVVLVLASVLARDASAHCFSEDNATHFELLSSTLPKDGALVVEWGPRGLFNPLAKSDQPGEDATAFQLTAGGTTFEVTRKNIAPGLLVLVPTTAPSGKVEVTTPSGEVRTVTFGGDSLPVLAAPRVTKLVRRVAKRMRGEKRAIGIVTVKGDAPDDAIALVAYVGNKAVAWARTGQDEAGGIEIFHDALPCWSQPNAAPAPRAGTKVSFAWLDGSGRLSKRSAAIAIK